MSESLQQWPDGLGRSEDRSRSSRFKVPNGKSRRDLEAELGRLDPDDWRVYTGNQHTKSNGLPLSDANPDDPGFALKWTKSGEVYAVGCDAYTSLFDNVREVFLWLRETRKRSDRPVQTGSSSFGAAKLPPGEDSDHETEVVVEDPYEVLGVREEASLAVVEAAYEEVRNEAHPDKGGDAEEFIRVQKAWEQIQSERGEADA